MVRNEEKQKEELLLVSAAARNEWASRVINTLLVESKNGNMTMPVAYKVNGISIQRNFDSTGWNINFQIKEEQ
jgi:hypothetical protein